MLAGNAALFDADPDEQKKERAEGYALYEEKPNLRRKGKSTAEDADGGNVGCGTWSDAEYGLAGFQWMYLRLKSFQVRRRSTHR